MKIHAAVFVLILAGAVPARAFLGDDFQTVAARYGQPIHSVTRADGSQPMLYDCEGFRVVVNFADGRSVSESFSRQDRLTPFSPETLQAFLDAHSAGRRWRETARIDGQRGWQRAGALALYDERSFRPTLIISSSNYPPSVEYATSRVLAVTWVSEGNLALESAGGPQTLALGHLETGRLQTAQLETGHLETGRLQISSLQTGGLQIGRLGDHASLH